MWVYYKIMLIQTTNHTYGVLGFWGFGVLGRVMGVGWKVFVGGWAYGVFSEIVISEPMRGCVCVCVYFFVCVCLCLGLGLGLGLCLRLRLCLSEAVSVYAVSETVSCLCLCLCAIVFSCGNVCIPDQICTVWLCLFCVCVCHRECFFIVRACGRCKHNELSDSHKLSPAHVPGS